MLSNHNVVDEVQVRQALSFFPSRHGQWNIVWRYIDDRITRNCQMWRCLLSSVSCLCHQVILMWWLVIIFCIYFRLCWNISRNILRWSF